MIYGARIEYVDQHTLWIKAKNPIHAKKQLKAHIRRMAYPITRAELFRPMHEEQASGVLATMKKRTFKFKNHNKNANRRVK